MQLNDLDQRRLRRLAALRADGKILTLYLNLDPAEFGTQPARAAQVGSLLDEAHRRMRALELDHAAHAALVADMGRARTLLSGDGFSAKGAHALAIFICGRAGLFEVLRLPEPVATAAVVDDLPWLDPLMGRAHPRRCVALVSRRTLRVLLDTHGRELEEVADVLDEVHGRHDQGGWSQANYERSIEDDVRKHVDHAAQTLFALHRREPFDLLAIGVSAELWPDVERALHPYLRERTLGRFDVDVEHASPETALEAARQLFAAAGDRRTRELLERVRSGLAHGERAVAGLGPVLGMLSARRVATLLYDAGFHAPGFTCAESGWLGEHARDCPSGVERAQPQANVLEAAIAAALLQAAEVVALRDHPELGPLGGMAAVLRY